MAKALLRSFARGIITPEMYGRIDLSAFQTGLGDALNFITLPHGPAARRPGTKFVQQGSDHSAAPISAAVKLLPFIFSSSQAYVIEVGTLYCRFHNASGTQLEANKIPTAVSIGATAIFTLAAHGYATGEWVYISSLPGMPSLTSRFYVVTRIDADNFSLRALPGELAVGADISTVDLTPYRGGGAVARVYTLSSPYTPADLIRYAQNNDIMTLCTGTAPARELRRSGATSWAFSAVSFAVTLAAPTAPTAVATIPTATNPTTQSYVITSLASDLITESAPTAAATCSNNLSIAGNFNTITWTNAAAAARYYVYKLKGGVYGYIGQATTGATGVIDDNISPDTLTTPPTSDITLNVGLSGDFPRAVTYYEQRRWFAGTEDRPQYVFATRNGTENNLTSSVPSRSDDALSFRIASQQQQSIQHLVPLQDVAALTSSGEHRIFSDGGGSIDIGTLGVKPQGSMGASEVQPVMADQTAMYVQAQGARIRELEFDGSGLGRFTSSDVSIMAPHLFDGYTILQLAYTRAPVPTLWCVRSDGVLLGLTHMPAQEVYGWHRHLVGEGLVESIAVIPEGGEDVLYMAVRRYFDNGNSVHHIERLTSRLFTTQDDAYFVDCGLTYFGSPATTITGLWHLEGRTVDILADGAVVTPQVVTNGAITLTTAASTVHVGLNYISDLQTLPQAYEGAPAGGQGTMKNVSKVYLRVKESSLVKAGPTFNSLTEYPARAVSDPYDSPSALRAGELGFAISPSWTNDGVICVRQDQPLPLTVAAITHDTATGG